MGFDPNIDTSGGNYDASSYDNTGTYSQESSGQTPQGSSAEEFDSRLDPYAAQVLRDVIEKHTAPLREATADYKLDRDISRIARQLPDFADNEVAILTYAMKTKTGDLRTAYHGWKASQQQTTRTQTVRQAASKPEAKTVDDRNRRTQDTWRDADAVVRDLLRSDAAKVRQRAAENTHRSRAESARLRGRELSARQIADAKAHDLLSRERRGIV